MRDSINPGETLREDLDALGMSAAEACSTDRVPVNPHHRSPQWPARRHRRHRRCAWALLRDVGEFWLKLQKLYELRRAEQKNGAGDARLPSLDDGDRLRASG